jgi:hypothetical protein
VADIGNPAGCHKADEALPTSVRELCHDLLESAATIGVLAQVAGVEAGPAVAADSQLPNQLHLITAAASQITAICADVLDEFNPAAARLRAATRSRLE